MLVFKKELLQAVEQIEIRSRRNIASLLSGDYRSSFRGSGMQFKEFRHYEPGDDIRHMSWSVTARTGRTTVKVYEEERELNVLMMVDVSGSTLFGAKDKRKIDMYAQVSALLGLAAVKSGDPFGCLLFSDKVNTYQPPRRTQDHVRASILRLLAQPLSGEKSDIRPALAYARKVLKVRSLILILSDFLLPDFRNELLSLAKRHEVVLLHGFDDAERGSRLSGIYPVWNPETGEYQLLDGNSRRAKRKLAEFQTDLVEKLQTLGRSCGADYLPLSVEDDYLKRLVSFFRRRGAHR